MPTDDKLGRVALAEIAGALDLVAISIEQVKDKQDEMAENIAQIREAVYHPYEGLYARIRQLESWKENSSRLLWIIVTAVIGLSAGTIYKIMLA